MSKYTCVGLFFRFYFPKKGNFSKTHSYVENLILVYHPTYKNVLDINVI